LPPDRIGFDAACTVRTSSVGCITDGALPGAGVATRGDDAQAASSGSRGIKGMERIMAEGWGEAVRGASRPSAGESPKRT
jgi:hypothetical protein